MNLKTLLSDKGYVIINLKKIATNHFELKAKINGIKGRFILDTGASNSCVDLSLADKFKLQLNDSETKAAGAGAVGMDTKIAHANVLKIDKWKFKNTSLVLLDLSHVNTALTEHKAKAVDGILGADILEKGKAIIDYKKKRLFLKKVIFKY